MCKIVLSGALSLGLMLSSLQAHAAFIETDWKSTGDKLSTLDTATGLEWLDLTLTKGRSIAHTIAELNEGGLYKGWRLPSASEVHGLMSSILSDYAWAFNQNVYKSTQVAYSSNNGASHQVRQFWQLFGMTQIQQGDASGSFGMYLDPNYNGSLLAGPQNGTNTGSGRDRYIYNYTLPGASYAYHSYGVFLVNDGGVTLSSIQDPTLNASNPNAPVNQIETEVPSVDVPAPAGLFALVLVLIGCMYRRKPILSFN